MINDCGQLCMPVHVRSTAPESTQRKRNPRKTLIRHNKSQPNGPRWWFLSRRNRRNVKREATTPDSVFKFSGKASFFLLFLLGFLISGARDGGQQQGVSVDFLVVRLDHRRGGPARAGLAGSGRCGGAARLGASANLVLPSQRSSFPVEHLRVFILLRLILVFIIQLCGQKRHRWSIRCFFHASVVTNPVSASISSSGEKYQDCTSYHGVTSKTVPAKFLDNPALRSSR